MSFLVTALKWRPQKFDEVVGQEHISVTLKNAIKNERIAHAYIFAGPRGVGKTTSARIFARSINCMNPQDGEPCNTCEMCKSFSSSQSLDIIEIDGASNRRIDEIRTLRESVKYAPTKGKYKVYIIDEVHMLTTESFNALLKTLEEPPEHTIFIFATTDIHKVPLTIISRCQRYDFRRIELNTIKLLLLKIAEAEGIKIDDKSLTLIAKKADGALRDAESLFDQVVSFCGNDVDVDILSKMLNLIDDDIYFSISDAIHSKSFDVAFDVTCKIYENGWNFIDFGYGLLEHFRNIMTVIVRKDASLIESAEVYKEHYIEYIDKFSEGDLLRITAFLNKLQYELKTTSNQRLKIEIGLSHLIGLEKSSTISQVLDKLNDLPVSTVSVESEKKKSEPINPSEPDKKVHEKETVNLGLTAGFDLEEAKSQKSDNSNKDINESEEIDEIPQYVKPTNVNPSDYKATWQQLIEHILFEKKLFGFLLKHTNIKSFENYLVTISAFKTDLEQIEVNRVSLLDKIEEYFGNGVKLKIDSDLEIKVIEGNKEIVAPVVQLEDNALTKAIKEELGGQEIRSTK